MSRAALPQRREAWRRREVHGARRRGGRGPSRRISVKSAVPPHTVSVSKQLGRPHEKSDKGPVLGFLQTTHATQTHTCLNGSSAQLGRSCSLGAVGRYLLPHLGTCRARHQRVPRRPPSSSCTLDCNFGRNEIFPQRVPTCSTFVRVRNHPSSTPPSLAPYLLAPECRASTAPPRPQANGPLRVSFGYFYASGIHNHFGRRAPSSVHQRLAVSPDASSFWTERIHERIPQRVPTCSTRVRQNRPYPPYTFSFVAPKCDCSH